MFPFLIVVVVFFSITLIVKMSLRYAENIERIRHGYPPLNDKQPFAITSEDLGLDTNNNN